MFTALLLIIADDVQRRRAVTWAISRRGAWTGSQWCWWGRSRARYSPLRAQKCSNTAINGLFLSLQSVSMWCKRPSPTFCTGYNEISQRWRKWIHGCCLTTPSGSQHLLLFSSEIQDGVGSVGWTRCLLDTEKAFPCQRKRKNYPQMFLFSRKIQFHYFCMRLDCIYYAKV